MTTLRKISLVVMILAASLSTKAITIDDFYEHCSSLPDSEIVSIPELFIKTANRHLSSLKIIDIDLSNKNYNSLIRKINSIKTSSDATIIKNKEDGESNYVILQPDGKNAKVLIASIDNDNAEIVYIKCSQKIINQIIEKYSKINQNS